MKWSVILLLVLGVMAAICAAVLVTIFGIGQRSQVAKIIGGGEEPTATILVASRALAPMTVVDESCLTPLSVPRSKIVAGTFTSSVEVTGKVLSGSLVKGQPFTTSSFTNDSARARLASRVPPGKRAVGIAVTDHAGLDGVLYPGSIVDVLGTFKTASGESVSTTLISRVEVLAIERQTIVLDTEKQTDSSPIAGIEAALNKGNTSRRVTLLVDLKQAKTLQLAMDQGTISLVLRNPGDAAPAAMDVLFSSNILQESGAAARDMWAKVIGSMAAAAQARAAAALTANITEKPRVPTTAPAQPAPPPKPPQWETIIIRGTEVETRQFEMPPETKQLEAKRG
jgi:pilus assembly protein CpaB